MSAALPHVLGREFVFGQELSLEAQAPVLYTIFVQTRRKLYGDLILSGMGKSACCLEKGVSGKHEIIVVF